MGISIVDGKLVLWEGLEVNDMDKPGLLNQIDANKVMIDSKSLFPLAI